MTFSWIVSWRSKVLTSLQRTAVGNANMSIRGCAIYSSVAYGLTLFTRMPSRAWIIASSRVIASTAPCQSGTFRLIHRALARDRPSTMCLFTIYDH